MKRTTLIFVILAASAMASCGGGSNVDVSDGNGDVSSDVRTGDAGGVPDGIGTEDDLITAATASFRAFVDGDDETYFDGLSSECRTEFGFSAVASNLQQRRTRAAELGGVDFTLVNVTDVVITDFQGDSAGVALVIEGTGDAEFVEVLPRRWIFQEGAWRLNDCSNIQEGQGGIVGGSQGTDRNAPLPLGAIADVSGWFVGTIYFGPDSEDVVLETEGNVPATDGSQYFLVQLNISYNGSEPSVVVDDEFEFAFVNESTVYGEDAGCGPFAGIIDPTQEVGPGEPVGGGGVCRQVASEDVDGLLLRVTHRGTGTEYWFLTSE